MIKRIKCLLKPKYWKDTKDIVELKDRQSKMTVYLTQSPSDGVVISVPEKGRAHISMLEEKTGCTIACDYLILVPSKDCVDVYFIEMKKNLARDRKGKLLNNKGCEQILHTTPVLDYLTSMVDIHFGEKKRVNRHFCIIAERNSSNLDKQKLKHNPSLKYTYHGERFNVIYSTTMPFECLK